MQNTARRQAKSTAEILNGKQRAKEKFHREREKLGSIYELL